MNSPFPKIPFLRAQKKHPSKRRMLSKNTMSWFITLRNCITFKHLCMWALPSFWFITIRNYITLKHIARPMHLPFRFITIRNCITLKPSCQDVPPHDRFITIRNYITLKQLSVLSAEFQEIYHYQKLHHSQTSSHIIRTSKLIYHYQKLHHSQTFRCA